MSTYESMEARASAGMRRVITRTCDHTGIGLPYCEVCDTAYAASLAAPPSEPAGYRWTATGPDGTTQTTGGTWPPSEDAAPLRDAVPAEWIEMRDQAWQAGYDAAALAPEPDPASRELREALDRVMHNVVCGEWYDDPANDPGIAAVNRLHDAEREMWALYDEFGIDPGDSYIRREPGWRTGAWYEAQDAAGRSAYVAPPLRCGCLTHPKDVAAPLRPGICECGPVCAACGRSRSDPAAPLRDALDELVLCTTLMLPMVSPTHPLRQAVNDALRAALAATENPTEKVAPPALTVERLREAVLMSPPVDFPNLPFQPRLPEVLDAVATWMDGVDDKAELIDQRPKDRGVQQYLREAAERLRAALTGEPGR